MTIREWMAGEHGRRGSPGSQKRNGTGHPWPARTRPVALARRCATAARHHLTGSRYLFPGCKTGAPGVISGRPPADGAELRTRPELMAASLSWLGDDTHDILISSVLAWFEVAASVACGNASRTASGSVFTGPPHCWQKLSPAAARVPHSLQKLEVRL